MAEAKKVNPAVVFLTNNGERSWRWASRCCSWWPAPPCGSGMSGEDPTIGLDKETPTNLDKEAKTPHPEMTAPNTEKLARRKKRLNPWSTLVASARPADNWGGFLVTRARGQRPEEGSHQEGSRSSVPPREQRHHRRSRSTASPSAGATREFHHPGSVQDVPATRTTRRTRPKVTHFVLEARGERLGQVGSAERQGRRQGPELRRHEDRAQGQVQLPPHGVSLRTRTSWSAGGKVDPDSGGHGQSDRPW